MTGRPSRPYDRLVESYEQDVPESGVRDVLASYAPRRTGWRRRLLLTYLQLAPDPELASGLVESGVTCVAYETVEDVRGRLPLLAPMSEVAGKIAARVGRRWRRRTPDWRRGSTSWPAR